MVLGVICLTRPTPLDEAPESRFPFDAVDVLLIFATAGTVADVDVVEVVESLFIGLVFVDAFMCVS